MSRWDHSICDGCWRKRESGRAPHRLLNAPPAVCCFCARSHSSGIYVRCDPAETICRGVHEPRPDVIPVNLDPGA